MLDRPHGVRKAWYRPLDGKAHAGGQTINTELQSIYLFGADTCAAGIGGCAFAARLALASAASETGVRAGAGAVVLGAEGVLVSTCPRRYTGCTEGQL